MPLCSFVVDGDGSLIVDLTRCPTLDDDNSVVVLEKSSLGRPLFLTHVTDQLFYALDSHCAAATCTAVGTPREIICPCDSTHYDLSGAVISGPDTKPLREFPSLKNGDRIRITLR